MNNKRKNSGFTLIELVVVVAIIGVLAAIVTPRIRTALMKAKDAKVVASLDALRTAANVYYAEKGVAPIFTAGVSGTMPTTKEVTINHLALLVKNGYLDKASAQKFYTGTDLDTLITTPTGTAGGTIINLPATTQDSATATNCTSVGTPAANPAYTQGWVGYIWEDDGVGIKVGTATGEKVAATALASTSALANTSCELWTSK